MTSRSPLCIVGDTSALHASLAICGILGRTSKGLGLVRGHRPEVLQIALVPDEHDHDVRVGVVPELLEPSGDVRVRLVFRDVVDEQRTDRTAVVRRRDRAIAFLAGCIRLRYGERGHRGAKVSMWVARRRGRDEPVSQICALTVLPSIASERVANSTPIVDLDSWLNSLRVNRERTICPRKPEKRPRRQIRTKSDDFVSGVAQATHEYFRYVRLL